MYADGLLDRLAATGLGCHVGAVCCAVPTAADDMASVASSLSILQKLVSEFVDYSKIERYLLQPSKSVILAITNQCRKRDEDGNINIVMNGERMPVVDETVHMGIL